jgi:hypothetical protein
MTRALFTWSARSYGDAPGGSAAVRSFRGDFELRWQGRVSAIPYGAAAPARYRAPCSDPDARLQTIHDVSSIPSVYILASRAVEQYRGQHAWPGTPVNTRESGSDVRFVRWDGAVVVTLTRPTLPSSLGCFSETYRVDVPSLAVRPFDSCPEAHPATGLPRFNELPAPSAWRSAHAKSTKRSAIVVKPRNGR